MEQALIPSRTRAQARSGRPCATGPSDNSRSSTANSSSLNGDSDADARRGQDQGCDEWLLLLSAARSGFEMFTAVRPVAPVPTRRGQAG